MRMPHQKHFHSGTVTCGRMAMYLNNADISRKVRVLAILFISASAGMSYKCFLEYTHNRFLSPTCHCKCKTLTHPSMQFLYEARPSNSKESHPGDTLWRKVIRMLDNAWKLFTP